MTKAEWFELIEKLPLDKYKLLEDFVYKLSEESGIKSKKKSSDRNPQAK